MEYAGKSNEELCLLAQAGDKDAETALYRQVERLIYKLTRRYVPLCSGAKIEEADLTQECWFGFHDAVQSFRRGESRFSTYLAFHVKAACMRALGFRNGGRRRPPETSLDAPQRADEDLTVADSIADENADVTGGAELTELQRIVRGAVACLSEREQSLICAVYVRRETVAGWSASEGVTRAAADRLHRKILSKLRHDPAIQAFAEFYERDSEGDRQSALWRAGFHLKPGAERRIDAAVAQYLAWCADNGIQANQREYRRRLVLWEAAAL